MVIRATLRYIYIYITTVSQKSNNWFLISQKIKELISDVWAGFLKNLMIDPYFLQTKRPTGVVFSYPWVTSSILQFLDIFTLSKCEYTWIVHAPTIRLGMLFLNTLSKDINMSLPSSYNDVHSNIKLKMFKILNLSLFLSGHRVYDESP